MPELTVFLCLYPLLLAPALIAVYIIQLYPEVWHYI